MIIPALNAAKSLSALISELTKFIPSQSLLVIDDGSVDQTSRIASEMGVNVVRNPQRMGKGCALRRGFDYAIAQEYDAVITVDADLQHPPELIPRFLEKARGADVVIGNRMSNPKGMPFDRRLSNTLTSLILSLVTHRRIPDSQCGYRLIKTKLLSMIRLRSKHYEIEGEMLIKLARLGAKFDFVEVPVIYNKDGESYINRFLDTLRFIKLVLCHIFLKR